MPVRKTEFAPGEHYHICVRGNNKQVIFRSRADRARLLFLILHLQSKEVFSNIHRSVRNYLEKGSWGMDDVVLDITNNRYVALEAFAFMDNHVHLAIKEDQDYGITRYLQRVLTAYAKYMNTKYETVGHIFQSPYRAIHVEDNDQLLYLSAYIHRNPRELPGIAGREHGYEWSSYRDYLGPNRFGELLDPSLVLDQFDSANDYRAFIDSSVAKEEHLHPF